MKCFETEIQIVQWPSNEPGLLYTCTGSMVRPEGFEEYITTLTFIRKKVDSDSPLPCDSIISLVSNFDLDASEPRPHVLRLDQCHLFQMKVRFLERQSLQGM
jgi:hypothetical protein